MYLSVGPEVGKTVLTASGLIGDSAKPQALYGYAFKSDGTAGVATFFDGTSSVSPAAVAWDDSGTVNVTKVVALPAAPIFTNGLYVSLDAHVTRCTVFSRQVIS